MDLKLVDTKTLDRMTGNRPHQVRVTFIRVYVHRSHQRVGWDVYMKRCHE